jgi:hypothetical protein
MWGKGPEGLRIDADATLTEETDVNPSAGLELVALQSRSFPPIHGKTFDSSVSNVPWASSKLDFCPHRIVLLPCSGEAERCSSADTGGTFISANDRPSDLHHPRNRRRGSRGSAAAGMRGAESSRSRSR